MLYVVLFLLSFKRQIHVDAILTTPKARHIQLHSIFQNGPIGVRPVILRQHTISVEVA
jgi:hypothetical protein